MTLQECKDEVALKEGWKKHPVSMVNDTYFTEVAELYAQQFKDKVEELGKENERLIEGIRKGQHLCENLQFDDEKGGGITANEEALIKQRKQISEQAEEIKRLTVDRNTWEKTAELISKQRQSEIEKKDILKVKNDDLNFKISELQSDLLKATNGLKTVMQCCDGNNSAHEEVYYAARIALESLKYSSTVKPEQTELTIEKLPQETIHEDGTREEHFKITSKESGKVKLI